MTDKKRSITFPTTKAVDVVTEVRRIARDNSEDMVLLDHALERMVQRNISSRQIINVLKNGEQVGTVTWCSKKELGWRCRLRRVTAGMEVTVIAKLVERDSKTVLIVTVFGEEE